MVSTSFHPLQICSALPAALYTKFPDYPSILLRLTGYISLVSPLAWPWQCLPNQTTVNSYGKANYHSIMGLTSTLPLLAALIALICTFVYFEVLYCLNRDKDVRKERQNKLALTITTGLIFFYQIAIGGIGNLSLGSLPCINLDPTSALTESFVFLWNDVSIDCNSGAYRNAKGLALLSSVVYLALIPVRPFFLLKLLLRSLNI